MTGAYGTSEEYNIWPTYTDVTFSVLLLMIFIMLAQYVVIGKIFEINRIEREQTVVREALKRKFGKDFGIYIKESSQPQFQRISFSDQVLFNSNSDVLKPQGKMILKKIAEIIHEVKGETSFDEIQVRGHTDNRPINNDQGNKFPTNWELSSARATSVVRYFVDECGLESTKNFLISAQGYSEYDYVTQKEDAESLALNRRVELAFKYPLAY